VGRRLDEAELAERWTLRPAEVELLRNKTGATRLGFALLARFLAERGRFPRGRSELPDEAVEYVARQVVVSPGELGFYDWSGRSIKDHRAQIRRALGFRECTVADADKLAAWLAVYVAGAERRPERVRDALIERCRAEQIEPPAAARVDRSVRSALHQAEARLCAGVLSRLDPAVASRLDALVAAAPDADEDGAADNLLARVKADAGRVGLDTMLGEIDKLAALRALGLPAGLFTDVAANVVIAWRTRAAAEKPSQLREHPTPVRLTLLAALCHRREREITDTLVDLLISIVHKINVRAEQRVTEALLGEFKQVRGKTTLLFRMAEALRSVGPPPWT
jgi:hypothetical protein